MNSLIVLLHGAGQTPADMAPLAGLIAAHDPQARVAAPPAFERCDRGGAGFQWMSVTGVTDENRPGRIRAALPAFVATKEFQHSAPGVPPPRKGLDGV